MMIEARVESTGGDVIGVHDWAVGEIRLGEAETAAVGLH